MQFLKGKFQDRHFPTNITQIPFEPFEHREDILHGDTIHSKENNNHRITFSCKYNYGMPIHNLLEENWGGTTPLNVNYFPKRSEFPINMAKTSKKN